MGGKTGRNARSTREPLHIDFGRRTYGAVGTCRLPAYPRRLVVQALLNSLCEAERMDMTPQVSLSPRSLYRTLGTAAAPLLVDVRREPTFAADDTLIAGAIRRDPESAAAWRGRLPTKRPICVYCGHGHECSQGVAASLGEAGHDARYLEGGIAAWREAHLPTMR